MTLSERENIAPVVVMPTFNNDRTLADIIARVALLSLPMIVVDDGCTDSTPAVLERWKREHPETKLDVHVHPVNRGKAAALKTGFAAAGESGFTHAITIDTDGQHDPEEIPVLLQAARKHPQAYVLGFRDDTRADYPAKSRVGRRISNAFIHLESGLRVRDSQCGMRVYPLRLVQIARCRAGHFGYEAEIITRAGWSGCPIVELPIVTRYLSPGQRVSHFRPWLDTVRGIGMHIRLLARALLPWPRHPKYAPSGASHRQPLVPALWRWINPMQAWRDLRRGELSRNEVAAALAVGVFIANLPAYGFQTILSLYTARRLHLQPVAVVAGSHVSIPPLAPFLIAAAIGTGHLVLHRAWPGMALLHGTLPHFAGSLLLDWLVGGVVLGIAMAVMTFVGAQFAFRFADAFKRRRRTLPAREHSKEDMQEGSSAHQGALASSPARASR
jgi:uncharacterized protein (DUF2062 family)